MINYTEQEEQAKRNVRNYTSGSLTIGVILIIAGVVIALSNLGIFSDSLRHLFISWQMLLIAFGIVGLVKGNKTAGTLLLLVGIFFILPKISYLWPSVTIFGHNFARTFWPFLIIVCGLGLVLTSRKEINFSCESKNRQNINNTENNNGYLNYNFVFSGTEQIYPYSVFKGGNIKATFGGATIDFRNSSLPENENIILNIESTFGGVTIIVPEQWTVEVRQSSFFGGFSDNRRHIAGSDPGQKLIINAKCAFGGGEVR